ncbi:MAG: hypothetical protein ACOYBY_01630 [Dermatophilaceae bacterium]
MSRPLTRGLVLAATALSGVVAGTSVDTGLVQLPAWRRAGPEAWAAHVRESLRVALPWYTTLGITTAVANVTAAVAVHQDDEAPPSASMWTKVAAVLVIAHLLASARAGPNMVKARDTHAPDSLRGALDSFVRWHGLRTGIDAATFAADLWSFASVSKALIVEDDMAAVLSVHG